MFSSSQREIVALLVMKRLAYLLVLSCCVYVQPCLASDEQATLSVRPNKCISLHRGQTCYQKLKFHWVTVETQNYCLYQLSKPEPLVCWQGPAKERFEYKFSSTTDEKFVIRREGDNTHIAEVDVTLAWVYKTKRKNTKGWRLF